MGMANVNQIQKLIIANLETFSFYSFKIIHNF